jgi:hypothetical protein
LIHENSIADNQIIGQDDRINRGSGDSDDKPQHDSQRKRLLDPGKKRDHQPRWLLGCAEENLKRLLDKISKKNLRLDIVLRNRHQPKFYIIFFNINKCTRKLGLV